MNMELEEFRKLKRTGKTNQELADYYKVSISTIKRFIKDNDLSIKNKPIDKNKFMELYNERLSDVEIASILGNTKTAITAFRKLLGVKSQTDRLREENQGKFLELYNQGLNDSEISKKIGVSNSLISIWRKNMNLDSLFEYKRSFDIAKFLELFDQGYNYLQISELLNVSSSAIAEYGKSLGLEPNIFCKDVPTEEQQQIIIGSLLGDMSLKMPKNAKHVSGDFAHSLKQENYCRYIENKLRNFCTLGFYRESYDKRTEKVYKSYYVYMKSSQYFTDIYYKFYPVNKKVVPKDLLYSLTGLGVAIWFMDDGYKDGNTYFLSTNCFSTLDLQNIQEFFKIKFDIETTVNKANIIRVRANSALKFKELVLPYMHEECIYKLYGDIKLR